MGAALSAFGRRKVAPQGSEGRASGGCRGILARCEARSETYVPDTSLKRLAIHECLFANSLGGPRNDGRPKIGECPALRQSVLGQNFQG